MLLLLGGFLLAESESLESTLSFELCLLLTVLVANIAMEHIADPILWMQAISLPGGKLSWHPQRHDGSSYSPTLLIYNACSLHQRCPVPYSLAWRSPRVLNVHTHGCRIWFYWGVDPLSYAQKGMAVNEFDAPRWQKIYVDSTNAQTIGDAVLSQRGLPNNEYERWLGFSVLVSPLHPTKRLACSLGALNNATHVVSILVRVCKTLDWKLGQTSSTVDVHMLLKVTLLNASQRNPLPFYA